MDAARQTAYSSTAAVQGVVEDTVATAYTVIDRYMNRGYAAAGHQYRANGGYPMSDTQPRSPGAAPPSSFGGPGGPGAAPPSSTGSLWGWPGVPGAWGAMNPWMGPWLQMMRMWTDTMTAVAGPAAQGWAAQLNPWASAWGAGSGAAKVSVEVQSKKAVEVTVDLHPGAEMQRLRVGPLKAPGGGADAPAIEGVELETRPGHVTARVRVDDEQPSGSYVGTVEDDQGQSRGEVHVRVS